MNANRIEETIVISGRDNWTERYLDRIEEAARGRIVSHQDDGAGGRILRVRPSVRYTKPERKAILEAVKALAPKSRWE